MPQYDGKLKTNPPVCATLYIHRRLLLPIYPLPPSSQLLADSQSFDTIWFLSTRSSPIYIDIYTDTHTHAVPSTYIDSPTHIHLPISLYYVRFLFAFIDDIPGNRPHNIFVIIRNHQRQESIRENMKEYDESKEKTTLRRPYILHHTTLNTSYDYRVRSPATAEPNLSTPADLLLRIPSPTALLKLSLARSAVPCREI